MSFGKTSSGSDATAPPKADGVYVSVLKLPHISWKPSVWSDSLKWSFFFPSSSAGLYFFQICQSVYFQLLLHCRSLSFSFFIFFFSQPRIFYRYVGRLTDRRDYCLRSFLLRFRDRTSAPIAFFLLKLFLVPFRDNCYFRRIRFSW